jgi:hypothetical protein
MNIYKSFADFANAQIRNLNEISQNTIVRESAIVIAGAIKQRVENFGADSDGVAMQSFSKERFGAYSKAWGEQRAKKGRQTAKIDLNYTGDMFKAWLPVPTKDGWGATFVTKEAMQKAFENQAIFRTTIFAPSDQEIQLGNNAMIQRVQKILKRK